MPIYEKPYIFSLSLPEVLFEKDRSANYTCYGFLKIAGFWFKGYIEIKDHSLIDTECNPSVGISKVADLLYGFGPLQNPIDVLFGPVCSVVCEPVGYLARDMGVPMISISCYSHQLSDKSVYPTFARTVGSSDMVSPVYVDLIRYLNFTRVAIFTGAESFYIATSEDIRKELSVVVDILVTEFVILPRSSSRDTLTLLTKLSIVRRQCRGKSV